MNKTGIIVIDFDDILVNFAALMYYNIRENWRIYSRWYADKGELTEKEIYDRNFFQESEWLIKDEYRNLTSKQYTTLMKTTFNMLDKTFYSKDVYASALPTKFAMDTLMNSRFMNDSLTKKVYILTRNATEEQKESKQRFIEKYFTHPKIQVVQLMCHGDQTKGEFIRDNKIDFDVFIDDEIPNIRDVVEKNHENLKGREFIIPEYGYNKMPIDLKAIIEEKGGKISYYKAF